MLTLGLGHETPAVLSVLAAFFGGSALGSLLLDRRISGSRFPARWYALLEAITCIWAIILAILLPLLSAVTAKIIGLAPSLWLQWPLSFALPFVYLLPATGAMGGTLIAIERVFSRLTGEVAVAGTYAANTFGAITGVLVVSFFLLPAAGFTKTLIILGVLSAVCSCIALILKVPQKETLSVSPTVPQRRSSVYSALFITGILGIGYEILMVRALSQVLENTVYSFAVVLAAYLFGTFLGAAIRQSNRLKLDNRGIILLLVVSTILGAVLLRITPALLMHGADFGTGFLPEKVFGELVTGLSVLFIPTIAMGYAFAHLSYQVRGEHGGFGRAIAVNTLGGMIAPVLFGVVLLPAFGLKPMLIACSAGYTLLVILPGFARSRSGSIAVIAATAVILVTGIVLTPSTLFFTRLQKGDTVVKVVDGVMATCTVVNDTSGEKHLFFNSRFQEGGTSSPLSDGREAVIPLLLHPDPCEALFLGIGAGVTFATAGWFENVHADGVELVPEMRLLLKHFIGDALPANCNLITADARRYVAVCPKKYDVVIADLYHPARDGAGFLYTQEHFGAVKRLLTPEGIFCQWLPLYQMDETTLRSIMITFTSVYPHSAAWLVNYSIEMPIVGLIGSMKPLTITPHRVETMNNNPVLKERLESLKLYSTMSLAGGFLGSGRSIEKFAGNDAINTDDYPVIMFDAPGFAYGKHQETPDAIVTHLIDSFYADGNDLFSASDSSVKNEAYTQRFNRYREARDRFIRTGIEVLHSGKTNTGSALIDSLLSFVQTSSDFEAAYNPLIGIALQQYRSNPQMSLSLLRKLDALCGMRSEARSIIDEIEER